MTAYYNEIDLYCADWLRNLMREGLIADGHVDTRSIQDVTPNDLAGFTQCHFFAGLGGWSGALRLAAWPDHREVWTGSCPCQPFSVAGRQGGFADERHLWPAFRYLIAQRGPPTVFGEQVASAADWLRLVRGDLEGLGYAVGAMPIEAASAGADTKRDRFYFVADSASDGREGVQQRTAPQIPKNGAFETLAARYSPGDSFANWRELLAGTEVRRLAHGVSSNVAVRPSLRAFGNAVDLRPTAAFIKAFR
jgi:DNA (cytosine-5)-methyltransferase 1